MENKFQIGELNEDGKALIRSVIESSVTFNDEHLAMVMHTFKEDRKLKINELFRAAINAQNEAREAVLCIASRPSGTRSFTHFVRRALSLTKKEPPK